MFHTTKSADDILRDGFRDREGMYLTSNICRGVWVADCPVDSSEGAGGEDVLMLELPEEVVREYEWEEDWRKWREFLVPAEVLNRHPIRARGRVCDDPEDLIPLQDAT